MDCFDGTLLAYFKNSTGITKEEPAAPTRTFQEIVCGHLDQQGTVTTTSAVW